MTKSPCQPTPAERQQAKAADPLHMHRYYYGGKPAQTLGHHLTGQRAANFHEQQRNAEIAMQRLLATPEMQEKLRTGEVML